MCEYLEISHDPTFMYGHYDGHDWMLAISYKDLLELFVEDGYEQIEVSLLGESCPRFIDGPAYWRKVFPTLHEAWGRIRDILLARITSDHA